MSDTNTIMGWALAAGIAALGGSILFGKVIDSEHPHKEGYAIADASGAETATAVVVPIATRLATADVAKGEAVFAKCKACHSINAGGANGVGPNIHGILGKPHQAAAGFAYSGALKAVAGNWDFEGMDKWLASPKKYAPGNKMSFPGISDAQERANLVAYLNTQGSNLPLPAAPAAGEVAPAEGAAPAAGAAKGSK